MYAWLWYLLPGPWWLRVLFLLVIIAAVLFVLAEWVFPWVDHLVSIDDPTAG